MASRNRMLMRSLLYCALAGAVLLSAGCGCGSKSSNLPRPYPDRGVAPPPSIVFPPWDDVDEYNLRWNEREYYRHSDARERWPSRLDEDIIYESWRTAASFIETLEHNRVLKGAGQGLPGWGQLAFDPWAARGEGARLEDSAYAIYALGAGGMHEQPVFVELDWIHPPAWEDCWVGVRYIEGGQYRWAWYRPTRGWRVQLDPLERFRTERWDPSVYVAVLVTGYERCVLEEIALRQRRWWY